MTEKVKEWEFRQDHHEELMICLKETGCLGAKVQADSQNVSRALEDVS